MDSKVRRTHFEHYFEYFVTKVSSVFAVRSLRGLFKALKSLSSDRTVKMADQNFCHKIFKIMFKMCSSDLRVHPKSILNVNRSILPHIREECWKCLFFDSVIYLTLLSFLLFPNLNVIISPVILVPLWSLVHIKPVVDK